MSEKKISDIIVSIDKNVQSLMSYISNQDMLIKNLYNKVSNLEKKLNDKDKSLKNNSISPVQKKLGTSQPEPSIDPINEVGATESENKMPGLKTGIFLDGDKLKSKDESLESDKVAKIPVMQTIKYSDGTAAGVVNVYIFDKNQNLIKSEKSRNGKWKMALPQGEYFVLLEKKPFNGKPQIKVEFPLTIPESKAPIELDQITV